MLVCSCQMLAYCYFANALDKIPTVTDMVSLQLAAHSPAAVNVCVAGARRVRWWLCAGCWLVFPQLSTGPSERAAPAFRPQTAVSQEHPKAGAKADNCPAVVERRASPRLAHTPIISHIPALSARRKLSTAHRARRPTRRTPPPLSSLAARFSTAARPSLYCPSCPVRVCDRLRRRLTPLVWHLLARGAAGSLPAVHTGRLQ